MRIPCTSYHWYDPWHRIVGTSAYTNTKVPVSGVLPLDMHIPIHLHHVLLCYCASVYTVMHQYSYLLACGVTCIPTSGCLYRCMYTRYHIPVVLAMHSLLVVYVVLHAMQCTTYGTALPHTVVYMYPVVV